MFVPTKSIFRSKTFWTNLIGGVVVLLEYVDTINIPGGGEAIATALVLANLVLRYLTTQPVAVRTSKTVARDHRNPSEKRKVTT
jgi:hypothetical protein